MKYLLKIKNEEGEVVNETEHSSLSDISSVLGVTYCSVRKNLQYSLDPTMKKGVKLSQVMFDQHYSVCVADYRLRETEK